MAEISEHLSDKSMPFFRTTLTGCSDKLSDMPKKDDPFRKAAGKRLKALRKARGFDTIRAFAQDLEIEEDRYDAWEKGKSLIPAQHLETLKQRYGVTADWIYYGDPSGLSVALHQELRKAA